MYRGLVISGVLFASLWWFAASQTPSSAQNFNQQRPMWEYRELEVHGGHFSRSAANQLGQEGWELVSTFTPTNRDAVNVLVFKRRTR